MRNWNRLLALVLCCAMLCCLVPCTQASAEIFEDEYGGIRFTTFEDLKELCSRTYDECTYISYPYNDGPTIVIKENITVPDNLEVEGLYVTFQVPEGVTVTVSENSSVYVTNWDVKGTLVNHGRLEPANMTVSGTLRNSGYMGLLSGGSSDLIVTGKIENTGSIEVQCSTDPEFGGTVTGLDKITNTNGGMTSLGYPFVITIEELREILTAAEKNPEILFTAGMVISRQTTIDSDLVIPENADISIIQDYLGGGGGGEALVISKGCTLTNKGNLDVAVPVAIAGTLCNEGVMQFRSAGEEGQKMTFASGSSYTGNGELWIRGPEDPQDAVAGMDLNDYLVLRNEWYYDEYVWGVWPKDVKADVTRLAGDNRFDTAIKAADEMLASTYYGYFDTIIVANGYNFADALSGSYLANVKGAPILLCWSGDSKYDYLNDDVVGYIKENLSKVGGTVYLLGGTSAVPQSLEDELTAFAAAQPDVTIKRLAGSDRFATNLLILEEAGVHEGDEILVCTATTFADSLSASATGKPILLAFNEYGKLYGGQEAYLKTLKNCTFTVIGGESAVSTKLADAFKQFGSVSRLAGSNRFETSVLVAETYFEAPHTAVLAYAWNFPDGLCGGPLAYSMDAPLILTMNKYESRAVQYFADKAIIEATVLGGTGLISDNAVHSIFALDTSAEILVK